MKQLIVLFSCTLLFFSCEKTIELDLDQSPEILIVEGLVTDELTHHYLKVSRSVQFQDTGTTPRVEGASVKVSDNEGNRWVYAETTPGFYESVEPFAGKIGNTYTLDLTVDEKSYSASDQLMSNGRIDSLAVRIDEEERQATDDGFYYEVLMYLTEPQATRDYYLFQFFRDNDPLTDDGETIFYTDDVAVREQVNGFAIPYYFKEGNIARTEIYSLSRPAFLYYRDLQENILNDGGMFSGQPANTSTNISGGALGFFRASSKQAMEIKIGE